MELYNRINRKTIKMSKKLITDELIEAKNDKLWLRRNRFSRRRICKRTNIEAL